MMMLEYKMYCTKQTITRSTFNPSNVCSADKVELTIFARSCQHPSGKPQLQTARVGIRTLAVPQTSGAKEIAHTTTAYACAKCKATAKTNVRNSHRA